MLHPKTLLNLLATTALVLSIATTAQALPYFDGPGGFGFDNSSLMLSPEIVLLPSTPGFVQSGVTDPAVTDLGLLAVDSQILDTANSIEREITWTLINNAPATLTDLVLVFTALGPSSSGYANANIDIDIDDVDPMLIANLQTQTDLFWFAGYRLTSADFDVNNMATRTFRYTVDVGEMTGGPPELGLMYITQFVPEPATGLLLGAALLVAGAVGRRRDR